MESNVSNIENVRTWLKSCSLLASTTAFRVDYINDDPDCYAIYSSPSSLAFTQDICGNILYAKEQTQNFYFRVSCPYGLDVNQNMENINALEQFIGWMYAQNVNRNFPTLQEGEVISILPTLSPYPQSVEEDVAIYQISIAMKYRRK